MKSGIIAVTTNGSIDDLTDYAGESSGGGNEAINITDTMQDIGFDTIGYEGEALREVEQSVDKKRVDGEGNITTQEDTEWITQTAGFLFVPEADREHAVIVISSASAEWALDLIGRVGGAVVERAEIDLRKFHDDHQDATYSMAGASEIGGQVDSLIAYGSDVFDARNVGEELAEGEIVGELNQVMVKYGWRGRLVNARLAASGYAQLNRQEAGTEEFLTWLADELLPYLSPAKAAPHAADDAESDAGSENDVEADQATLKEAESEAEEEEAEE